jgi:hypothetical protein
VNGLSHELDRIRENYHKLRGWLQGEHPDASLPSVVRDAPRPTGDERPVSQRELKLIIGLIIGALVSGAGFAIWILKLSGNL